MQYIVRIIYALTMYSFYLYIIIFGMVTAFLLDCQTTCGMGVPLILKALYGASWVPQVRH